MKPITLTAEDIAIARMAFDNYLQQLRTPGDSIDFKFKYDKKTTLPARLQKATVILSAKAYLKMKQLVASSNKELAWHGLVTKRPNSLFIVSDILCYPQKATAATVESNDDAYPQWLMGLSDEEINTLRFQGHSHVNFGVTPSATDTQNWDTFLNNIGPKDFYIFCIINKSGDSHWVIYDKELGVVYEKTDIDVKVYLGGGVYLEDWATTQIKTQITDRVTVTTQPNMVSSYMQESIFKNQPVKIVDENLYEPVGMTENGLDVYKDSRGLYVYDDYLHKDYLSKKEIKTQVALYADRKG